MPNAITFLVGANSDPFSREMKSLEGIARKSGNSLGMALSAGTAQGMHGGYSSIIRESFVIGREIAMGRGTGRIVGSGTLLLGYLSNLINKNKEAVGPAQVAANAYAKLVQRHTDLAKAAQLAAQQYDKEALAATGQPKIIELKLANARAARTYADSNKAVAESYLQQQQAAEKLIPAEKEAAALASKGTIGVFTGAIAIIAALAAIAAVAYFSFKQVVQELAGVEHKIMEIDYVAKQSQGINALAESWKKVSRAVQETIDRYYSAFEAAKRIKDAIDEEAETDQKLLDLEKEKRLAGARTAEERLAIEKDYNEKTLANMEAKFQKEEKNRKDAITRADEQTEALVETQLAMGKIPSATHDSDLVTDAETNLKEKRAAYAAIRDAGPLKQAWADASRTFLEGDAIEGPLNVATGFLKLKLGITETISGWFGNTGNATSLANVAEKNKAAKEVTEAIAAVQRAKDAQKSNEDLRKESDRITDEMSRLSTEAQAAEDAGDEIKAKHDREMIATRKIQAAQIDVDAAREANKPGSGARESANTLQRVGLMGTVSEMAESVRLQRLSERHLATLVGQGRTRTANRNSRPFGASHN